MREPMPLPAAETQAIDWVIRQRDPAFDAWEAFTDWLEADVAHADAYDRMAMMDAEFEALPVPVPDMVEDEAPYETQPATRFVNRRAWIGGAMAAALVGAIGLSMFGNDVTRIETRAGEHQSITLADGSRIDINGGSVVELDKDRPRYAKLESGEAMFHVIHRDGDPFTVDTAGAKLVDMGTAFNVIQRKDGLSVAVSEGIVLYNPASENVRLDAGRALRVKVNGKPIVSDIDISGVGGWRTGQLFYSGAPLSEVAADLTRTAGIKVSIAPAVAARPFHGALLVGADKAQAVDDLAALAGLRADKQADGWVLAQ